MYLTQTDIINYKIELGAIISNSKMLLQLIKDDIASKDKRAMSEGARYYEGNHDILNRVITYTLDNAKQIDPTRANNKLVNNFHRVLVDEKTAYILSAPIQFTTDDEKFQEVINNELGDWFPDICSQWIEGASNKGREFLHVYLNKDYKLEFIIIPAEQLIPIYDSRYQTELIGMIRYYPIEVQNPDEKEYKVRYKVEVYDNKSVTFYVQTDDEVFVLDSMIQPNPRPHWQELGDSTLDKSFEKVPFIELANNTQKMTDLSLIKQLQDAYNLALSDFANNLEDIQEIIYNLKGYFGQDLKQFMSDLKNYKAIKTDENGGVETIKAEIPADAREKFLQICEKNIYIFGQGFNPNDSEFSSNSSGVALKYKYSLLDLKSNKLINKLKSALKEFMYFVTLYVNDRDNTNFNYEEVKFNITKSMIVNETEQISNISLSKGVVPDEMLLAQHPLNTDMKEAMRMREEEMQMEKTNLDNIQPE